MRPSLVSVMVGRSHAINSNQLVMFTIIESSRTSANLYEGHLGAAQSPVPPPFPPLLLKTTGLGAKDSAPYKRVVDSRI